MSEIENKATENGGAFYISNGNYTMVGGELSHNQAITGDGGAIYISSTQNKVVCFNATLAIKFLMPSLPFPTTFT